MNFTDNQIQNINNNYLLNTSYPFNKNDWNKYKKNIDIFKNVNEYSFYVHIPFCKHMCSFCEYTKCVNNNQEYENKIIDVIINDIECFKKINFLYGFDIGGGTPTAISDANFKKLIDFSSDYISLQSRPYNFCPSIEATFDTISDLKIDILRESAFKRISFGIQNLNNSFLLNNKRYNDLNKITNIINILNKYFIINIDILYGLNDITLDDLKRTCDFVNSLNVSHITVYETRYNMLSTKPQKSKDEIFKEYDFLYNYLKDKGYNSKYGRNTFTKLDDEGVSSYLEYRMNGFFYKGFGPSAQSMTNKGISYNKFKNINSINTFVSCDTFEYGDIYKLPKKEILSKLIFISMYQNKIDVKRIRELYNINLLKVRKKEIKYLQDAGFIKPINNINEEIILTKEGVKNSSFVSFLLAKI